MQYTLLIYQSNAEFSARTDKAQRERFQASFVPYVKALTAAGIVVASGALESPDTATTIRLTDDQRHMQDGPYAETKEQLGGFFTIDVPDLDVALEWASRCPAGVAIELRPNRPPLG
jgi:hypothetical protein